MSKRVKALILAAVMLTLTIAPAAPAYALTEPELYSAAGIVINADTGEVLWGKDAESRYYPASITKVMTALLVMENCSSLDETVTFSKTATTNLESGATTIKLAEGDRLSVRDCLYALMLKSANEVANGLAEHVGGSISGFADMMNRRAKELGCTNTHFVNPNGLNNAEHYTTAHDMALIAAAAFKNGELRKIDTAQTYKLPATKNNPGGITLTINNKILMPKHEKYYKYAIAGKTGYTKKAGNTLVTMAQKDGVTLVAVTLKNTKYLAHYDDTKAMLEYGFELAAMKGGSTTADAAGSGNTYGSAAGDASGSGSPSGSGGTGAADGSGNTGGSGNAGGPAGGSTGSNVQLVGPGE